MTFTPLSEPDYDRQHEDPRELEAPACKPLGYSVQFGEYGLVHTREFASFTEALAFYRTRRAYQLTNECSVWYCLAIQNDALADGSEDGCGDGLTDEEVEQVENDSPCYAMLERNPSGREPYTCGHAAALFGGELDRVKLAVCKVCGTKWKEIS